MLALADMLPELDQLPELVVTGLSDDSRSIAAGDAFVAVRGELSDGHEHISDALEKGAVVVLAEKALSGLAVPVVVVPGLKRQRSEIAGRFFAEPSSRLHCVGVTGTNGKTSVAYYLAELANGLGFRSGYLGTIGWGFPDALNPAQLTTDSAINTQKRLHDLEQMGAQWVAMEVSSHALDQDRVAAVHFDVAVFTNLSRDHLDYHDSLEAYGAAKAKLFQLARTAVVNTDDEFGAKLAQTTSAGEVISYGRSGDIR
jgi:UDP-N-acetylmuramoyl-L-alanyl-D-glutamate--2,6-diaminopimelate ligase